MPRQSLKKCLLAVAGLFFLVLGTIGFVLPVLPATPFLLLAAFCFLRSSSRLYDWMMGHKIFGPYIYNYLKYRAVMKRAKIIALLVLWVSLLISILVVNSLPVQLLLLMVGLLVSIHIATLKTVAKDKYPDDREPCQNPGTDETDRT